MKVGVRALARLHALSYAYFNRLAYFKISVGNKLASL